MIFTPLQEYYLLLLHTLSNNNQGKAARMFKEKFGIPLAPQTIGNRWRKGISNYSPRAKGGYSHGLPEKTFKMFYEIFAGDVQIISEESGASLELIIRRCQLSKLKPENVPREYYINRRKKKKSPDICDKFVYYK